MRFLKEATSNRTTRLFRNSSLLFGDNSTGDGNATWSDWGSDDDNVTYCGIDPHDYLEAKFYLIAVTGTIIGAFGVFGNVTTTLILSRPSMRSPNNLFLTALAVFDSCLLITAFFIYSMEYIIEFSEALDLYVAWLTYLRFAFAVSHISQTGSVYTTVAVTVERYLAVVYPTHSKTLCTKHGAVLSILGVTAFAVLFNCTKFFELEVVRNAMCPRENFQSYLVMPGVLGMNKMYGVVYTLWLSNIVSLASYLLMPGVLGMNKMYGVVYTLWLSNIVMVFFPFLCLLGLNSIIAIYIRNSLKRLKWTERLSRHNELKEKSRDATLVLVVIVFIFLICNFWGFILTLYESLYGMRELRRNYHKFYTFSREAVNLLAIVNSSINFIIYCIFGKDFRKELIVIYGCTGVAAGIRLPMPTGDRFATWRNRTLATTRRRLTRASVKNSTQSGLCDNGNTLHCSEANNNSSHTGHRIGSCSANTLNVPGATDRQLYSTTVQLNRGTQSSRTLDDGHTGGTRSTLGSAKRGSDPQATRVLFADDYDYTDGISSSMRYHEDEDSTSLSRNHRVTIISNDERPPSSSSSHNRRVTIVSTEDHDQMSSPSPSHTNRHVTIKNGDGSIEQLPSSTASTRRVTIRIETGDRASLNNNTISSPADPSNNNHPRRHYDVDDDCSSQSDNGPDRDQVPSPPPAYETIVRHTDDADNCADSGRRQKGRWQEKEEIIYV